MIGDDTHIEATQKTVKEAVADYMESKHGTNRRYEIIKQEVTLLERQLTDGCDQRGIRLRGVGPRNPSPSQVPVSEDPPAAYKKGLTGSHQVTFQVDRTCWSGHFREHLPT